MRRASRRPSRIVFGGPDEDLSAINKATGEKLFDVAAETIASAQAKEKRNSGKRLGGPLPMSTKASQAAQQAAKLRQMLDNSSDSSDYDEAAASQRRGETSTTQTSPERRSTLEGPEFSVVHHIPEEGFEDAFAPSRRKSTMAQPVDCPSPSAYVPKYLQRQEEDDLLRQTMHGQIAHLRWYPHKSEERGWLATQNRDDDQHVHLDGVRILLHTHLLSERAENERAKHEGVRDHGPAQMAPFRTVKIGQRPDKRPHRDRDGNQQAPSSSKDTELTTGGVGVVRSLVKKALSPRMNSPPALADASERILSSTSVSRPCSRCQTRDENMERDEATRTLALLARRANPKNDQINNTFASRVKTPQLRHRSVELELARNAHHLPPMHFHTATPLSLPAPTLPVSTLALQRLVKAETVSPQLQKDGPLYQHVCGDGSECPQCQHVKTEITHFENTTLRELSDYDESSDEDNVPVSPSKSMMLQSSMFKSMMSDESTSILLAEPPSSIEKQDAASNERALGSHNATGGAGTVTTNDTPSIAQLYRDTSHRDREDLYISCVGGLSFDLSRDKFRMMVNRVLAPRLNVVVTEDHIYSLFGLFDINGGGTVSYFEYITVLGNSLLSSQQTSFLEKLFQRLCELRAAQTAHLSHTVAMAHAAQSSKEISQGKRNVRPASRGLRAKAMEVTRARVNALSPTMELRKEDVAFERLKRTAFDLLNKSLLFPHPEEEELCEVMFSCFEDLSSSDAMTLPKFKLLLFCDDEVMSALKAVV